MCGEAKGKIRNQLVLREKGVRWDQLESGPRSVQFCQPQGIARPHFLFLYPVILAGSFPNKSILHLQRKSW